jgi:predicted tellurium resistance membrane protein TerC
MSLVAVDTVPTIFAVKSDPFIVFISFVFTITSFWALCFLPLEMI